jgi:cullin 3
MIDNNKIEDLALMYRLFRRVEPNHRTLSMALKAHIELTGGTINMEFALQNNESDIIGVEDNGPKTTPIATWVEQILQLHTKYNRALEEAFDNDPTIYTCVTEGFSSFLNSNADTAEFMSCFIDEELRKDVNGKCLQGLQALPDATILLQYLHPKDLFEECYRGHMAMRLLEGQISNDDAEQDMLKKLHMVPELVTTKLEEMFEDIKVAREMSAEYKMTVTQSNTDSPELSVSILTPDCWPKSYNTTREVEGCALPPVMENMKSSFERFYTERHPGKRLYWLPRMVHFPGYSSDLCRAMRRFA